MKKKKKKNGFTLPELIAVIVLLVIVALIAINTIKGVLNKANDTIDQDKEKQIINAAEKWAIENSDKFDDTEGTTISTGLDILYILDTSGSMRKTLVGSNWNDKIIKTRYYNTMLALNASMKALEGRNNKIMISTFGERNQIALPLSSYYCSDGKYFESVYNINSYSSGNAYEYATIKSTSNMKKVDDSGTQSPFSAKIYFNEGNTKTQIGIDYAIKKFLASTTADKKNRIPVVIFITDGVPDGSGSYNSSLCSICSSSDRSATGLASQYYYALMAAYEGKNKISNAYNGNAVFFYTIGFGIDEETYGKMILKPEDYPKIKKYNYVTKAFQQKGMTSEDLNFAFSQITTEVIEASKVTQMCVTTEDLYKDGYLSSKDLKLSNGKEISEYVLISMNEATNQYVYTMARTDDQKKQCKELLENAKK